MGRKSLTQEQFNERVFNIYGDKYSPRKAKYINSREYVIIICEEHGEFLVKPKNFIRKKKKHRKHCPGCVGKVESFSICEKHNMYEIKRNNVLKRECPKCLLQKDQKTKSLCKKHNIKYEEKCSQCFFEEEIEKLMLNPEEYF